MSGYDKDYRGWWFVCVDGNFRRYSPYEMTHAEAREWAVKVEGPYAEIRETSDPSVG